MPSTPIYALPYPAAGDPADVPTDMQELADRIEVVLSQQAAAAPIRKLTEIVLAAPGNIDLPSIPQDASHLYVVAALRSTRAATDDSGLFRFNNDAATANYVTQRLRGQGTTASAVESINTIAGVPYDLFAANTVDYLTSLEILIPNYRAGAARRSALYSYGWTVTATAGGWVVVQGSAVWTTTAAINRITFFATNGNLSIGSRATVYGLA